MVMNKLSEKEKLEDCTKFTCTCPEPSELRYEGWVFGKGPGGKEHRYTCLRCGGEIHTFLCLDCKQVAGLSGF